MAYLYLVLTVAIVAFACFGEVASVPLEEMLRGLTPKARNVLKRATPVAPHFVLYSDAYVSSEPSASDISVSFPFLYSQSISQLLTGTNIRASMYLHCLSSRPMVQQIKLRNGQRLQHLNVPRSFPSTRPQASHSLCPFSGRLRPRLHRDTTPSVLQIPWQLGLSNMVFRV